MIKKHKSPLIAEWPSKLNTWRIVDCSRNVFRNPTQDSTSTAYLNFFFFFGKSANKNTRVGCRCIVLVYFMLDGAQKMHTVCVCVSVEMLLCASVGNRSFRMVVRKDFAVIYERKEIWISNADKNETFILYFLVAFCSRYCNWCMILTFSIEPF